MIYVTYLFGVMLGFILLVVILGALRPSAFQISRSQWINASPAAIFPDISNLRAFQKWNPFRDKDPRCLDEFRGPEAGPGAVFHWKGDANVGEGIMTIMDQVPNSKVGIDLEFIRPFPGHNAVEFTLTPQDGGTVVTWSMAGRYALVPRIVGLFLSLDRMIGGDFERGLQRLKSIHETPVANPESFKSTV